MKKIILNLCVLSVFVLAMSCGNDDDNNDVSQELVMTVDGETLTFDSVDVSPITYTEAGGQYTELEVTGTIAGNSDGVIVFELDQGDTGTDAVYYFEYTVNGVEYYDYNFDSNFNMDVTVNNGSNITATFSGDLIGYDFNTDEEEIITIENGSISVDY